ncbi:MAG: hypothetical protein QM488_12825 [Rhizobiaceae bacterium]
MEKKTYGRELAAGVLLWYLSLFTHTIYQLPVLDRIAQLVALAPYVISLVALAWGAKNLKHAKQFEADGNPRDIVRPERLEGGEV